MYIFNLFLLYFIIKLKIFKKFIDKMNTRKNKNDIKIIVVGNSGTGKTSFVNKWTKNTFTEKYKATIVSEFSHKVFDYKGQTYKIQLWDLAGMFIFIIIKYYLF